MIFGKTTKSPRYSGIVNSLSENLTCAFPKKFIIQIAGPVHLSEMSLPEPALTVCHRKDYADNHPSNEEVYLIVEVADSPRHSDVKRKLPFYAAAKIPEYWIIDLENEWLELCREPNPEEKNYRHHTSYKWGDDIQSPKLGTLKRSETFEL